MIYKSSWSLKKAFKTDNHVKTIEQAYGKKKEYKTCYFLSPSTLISHRKDGHNFLHIGLVQVAVKPLIREGLNCSILMAMRDTRHIRLLFYHLLSSLPLVKKFLSIIYVPYHNVSYSPYFILHLFHVNSPVPLHLLLCLLYFLYSYLSLHFFFSRIVLFSYLKLCISNLY